MANIGVMDILRAKRMSPLEFNFDNLWIPPMNYFLSFQDIENLRKIATSLKLSSKIDKKYEMIDNIMRNRGFKRFSAGTNRVVYSFLEDDRFLVKIAVDRVGMQDNPMEYKNQFLLKPFVTKMFYTSPCGTVGFSERVLPIKNKEEFKEIADDVFEILVNKILGKYVVEDVGTKFFMNWGIRLGYGPVLLDYPYVYKLDGGKLYCSKQDPRTGGYCNGEIDYDEGFNHLVCTKCGKVYLATDLRDNKENNKIIIKGGSQMKVELVRGDEVLVKSIETEEVIRKPKRTKENHGGLEVAIYIPGEGEKVFNEEVKEEKKIAAKPAPKKEAKKATTVKKEKVEPAKKEETVKVEKEKVEEKKETTKVVKKSVKKEEVKKEVEEPNTATDFEDEINKYDEYERLEEELIGKSRPRDSRGRFIPRSSDDDGIIKRKGKNKRVSTKSNFIE